MTSGTAAGYETFAAVEARGVSPLYEEWAAAEGRLVLSQGGVPQAFTGPHGQSYEAL
ncbi:hypothetical protein [Arthrobacter caoxuetaonis]|uniref:Uncharacterized protein n=1 Tax=Arthrobacter caoxuetaonis TaxID=2886935 RepID=A0A9X1MEA2_9MICC|nr:hypothetical protein [Arthrobacter caoxuetaonis]MCC3298473.1 hypothetical protein [Arthrobacter caoxuetaonis]USQ57515.1 hypothetical protein NF551_01225 [Arthrobacter caoxuetaonis]